MLLHPEVQATAQKELDAVIGPNRLPSFEDRNSLPYIAAICKEVLRWHPLGTTAFPHTIRQDDVVGPYFIPAGTIIFGHSWCVLWDCELDSVLYEVTGGYCIQRRCMARTQGRLSLNGG